MDEKKRLLKEIAERRKILDAMEDKEREAQNRPLVGKCYKFRNSYGSGKKWWLYKRVTSLRDGEPIGYEFEYDGAERFDCRIEKWRIYHGAEDIEISAREFNAAWDEFLGKLMAIHQK